MQKIVQLQAEALPPDLHDLPELVQNLRLAVWREPHHLVLVAVLQETEVLGHRGVEDANRVREADLAQRLDRRALPHTPHCTHEVAESVDRQAGRRLER